MKKTITLNCNKRTAFLNLNYSKPYIKFGKIHFDSITSENKIDDFKFYYKVFPSENKYPLHIDYQKNQFENPNPKELNSSERIEVYLETNFNENEHWKIEIDYYNIDFKISNSLVNPEKQFTDHLSNTANRNILFSAPFGQGKTTFLEYYFSRNDNSYEILKIFPINYSVANNEDIFKYIKADILFQLLDKVKFDSEKIETLTTISEYFYLNPTNTISTFLKIILSLNKQTEGLKNVITHLEDLTKEIKEYAESNSSDSDKVKVYIEKIYNSEGTIYESNYYTDLIVYYLNLIKENKKTVLIIEDLDRLDPDHLFRILNVISAHYDSKQLYDENYSNKFGFDRVILVGDIKNIKNIFEYRYGKEVNFEGYVNKFYSSNPFEYNNTEMMLSIIYEKSNVQIRDNYIDNITSEIYYIVLQALVKRELITFRRFLTLDIEKISSLIQNEERRFNDYKIGLLRIPVFKVLHYFNSLFPTDIFKRFLNELKLFDIDFVENKEYMADLFIYSLFLIDKTQPIDINLNETIIRIINVESRANYPEIKKMILNNSIKEIPNYKFDSLIIKELIQYCNYKYLEFFE